MEIKLFKAGEDDYNDAFYFFGINYESRSGGWTSSECSHYRKCYILYVDLFKMYGIRISTPYFIVKV